MKVAIQLVFLLILLCFVHNARAATWYVRTDGGTAYNAATKPTGQCNGQTDAPYPGAGVNQPCAFSHWEYLFGDDVYGETPVWKIAGGDTVIIGDVGGTPGQFRIGYRGPNPNDYWGFCAGGPFYCYNPTIPSGTAQNPTKIYGRNYATHGAKTQLYGGYGLAFILNLAGTAYVDLRNLELTDHAQCARTGNSDICSSNYPLDDYATAGVFFNTGSANISLTDVAIHGLAAAGISGSVGGDINLTDVTVGYNPSAGWDADNHAGGSTGGTIRMLRMTIEFSGCMEEYPITHPLPAAKCWDQNDGGYGDAIGTGNGDVASWQIEQSLFRYNTQDGIDLLHSAPNSSMVVTRTLIYGNMGQTFKLGLTSNSLARNNLLINNCRRMAEPLAGAPAGYNAGLSLFCRAGDGTAAIWGGANTSFIYENNTYVGYMASSHSFYCPGGSCNGGTKIYRNNIDVGIANPNYNLGLQPGWLYYDAGANAGQWTVRSNNLAYNMKLVTCPTSFSNELCTDPLLTNLPLTVISGVAMMGGEASLDALDLRLGAGSPAKDAGLTIAGFNDDFFGNTRPYGRAWDIGCYEFSDSANVSSSSIQVAPSADVQVEPVASIAESLSSQIKRHKLRAFLALLVLIIGGIGITLFRRAKNHAKASTVRIVH
jgi:hypothetical protein